MAMSSASSSGSDEGYLSSTYAGSFAGFGKPVHLQRSGGWLLERGVPGTHQRDLTGLYPVFCCEDWARLPEDLGALGGEAASVVVVPDPFGSYSDASLRDAFDFVRPYKERFITAMDRPPEEFVSRHHRKFADRGLAQLDIEHCEDPMAALDEWAELYAQVCARHGIDDIRAFSAEAFRVQLSTPGLAMFRARHQGRTVAIHLWVVMGRFAYGHLAGHGPEAYRLHAAYALYWTALKWLATRVDSVDLGGAADSTASGNGGLAFFKRGWATGTKPGQLCGRILNQRVYDELAGRSAAAATAGFFPAYRAPGHLPPAPLVRAQAGRPSPT